MKKFLSLIMLSTLQVFSMELMLFEGIKELNTRKVETALSKKANPNNLICFSNEDKIPFISYAAQAWITRSPVFDHEVDDKGCIKISECTIERRRKHCMQNDKIIIQNLLKYDANPFIVDLQGMTCLHHAVENGHLHIVKIIIEHVIKNYDQNHLSYFLQIKNNAGLTAAQLAKQKEEIEIYKYLESFNAYIL